MSYCILIVRNGLLNLVSSSEFCIDDFTDGTQCMEWDLQEVKECNKFVRSLLRCWECAMYMHFQRMQLTLRISLITWFLSYVYWYGGRGVVDVVVVVVVGLVSTSTASTA